MSAPIAGVLSQTACGGPALISLLNDLIQDGSELVDIAFPQYAALLSPLMTELTTFTDDVTTELASTDTVAQKIAAIIADAAKVITPSLSGVAATVVVRVESLVAIVPQIVALVQQLTAAINSTPGGANAFFAAKHIKPPTPEQIAKLKAKNAALKEKLAAAKKTSSFVLPHGYSWPAKPYFEI
jgi:hypothetical protein